MVKHAGATATYTSVCAMTLNGHCKSPSSLSQIITSARCGETTTTMRCSCSTTTCSDDFRWTPRWPRWLIFLPSMFVSCSIAHRIFFPTYTLTPQPCTLWTGFFIRPRQTRSRYLASERGVNTRLSPWTFATYLQGALPARDMADDQVCKPVTVVVTLILLASVQCVEGEYIHGGR